MTRTKITITEKKLIKEGTSEKNGKTFQWAIHQLACLDENGEPIKETVKTFADFPLNEPIEVEVEKRETEQYGTEFMVKKLSNVPSREEFEALEARVAKLENSPAEQPQEAPTSPEQPSESAEKPLDDIPF